MDAPSHDTIDALLAELVPTTKLDERTAAAALAAGGGDGPARPQPTPARRRRWPLRLAVAVVAVGLAAAVFTAGLLVGRQTAEGDPSSGDPAADSSEAGQLGSDQAQPFGTASVNSEAGDAAQSDPTGLVARYRQELAARDLVSTTLSDDDLTRFGYAACVFAASADGPADFERFRTTAAADADTSLTEAEMAVAIDTAVVVFCPVDAERLGITA